MGYGPLGPFHGGNTGSNPVGDANKTKHLAKISKITAGPKRSNKHLVLNWGLPGENEPCHFALCVALDIRHRLRIEVEGHAETHFDGSRNGRNFTVDRQVEPLVLDSEVSGLEERRAYLKLGNKVARFAFEYLDRRVIAESFQPRDVEDDALDFDPQRLHGIPTVPEPPDLEAEVEAVPTSASSAAQEPEDEVPVGQTRPLFTLRGGLPEC